MLKYDGEGDISASELLAAQAREPQHPGKALAQQCAICKPSVGAETEAREHGGHWPASLADTVN